MKIAWLDDHFGHPLEDSLIGDYLEIVIAHGVIAHKCRTLNELARVFRSSSGVHGVILDVMCFAEPNETSLAAFGRPEIEFSAQNVGFDIASLLLNTIAADPNPSAPRWSKHHLEIPVLCLTNLTSEVVSEHTHSYSGLFSKQNFDISSKSYDDMDKFVDWVRDKLQRDKVYNFLNDE